MLRNFLFFGLALYFLLSIYPVNASIVDRIVAIVNNEIITLSEFNMIGQELLKDLKSATEEEKTKEEMEARSLLLDKLIEEKLIRQAAKRLGIKATKKEIKDTIEDVKKRNRLNDEEFLTALSNSGISYKGYRDNIEMEIIQNKFLERVIRQKVSISDEELKEYYINNENLFRIPSEVRLGQILFLIPEGISDEEKNNIWKNAEMVLNMIKEGEDFGELAAKFSDGQGANNGGDIGYIKKGEINPDIEKIVFSLEVGEVSNLIKTDVGIHIIKNIDLKEGAKKKFPEVKLELESILFNKKTEEAYLEWLEEIKATSYIEVKL